MKNLLTLIGMLFLFNCDCPDYDCRDEDACNFNPEGTGCYWLSDCTYPFEWTCYKDSNENGYYDSTKIISECGGNGLSCYNLGDRWHYHDYLGIEQGCINSEADNYNSFALEDDSTCYGGEGCTNWLSSNYDYWADIDDGSCID
jgi:hypothetical protein